jgi:putative proteasome-type protease
VTYCLAIRVDQGLVFGSDSRTNAGVDYVTAYSKMHVLKPAPDRIFVVLSAGSLATTQEIGNYLRRDIENPPAGMHLGNVNYLFEAAEYLGGLSQTVQQKHAKALSASGISGHASLILGGQIQGRPPEVMLIYPQGNFVAASMQTPYLQIGETKYGKPVLDRFLEPTMPIERAALVSLISLEGTAKSNVTVGPPFEISLLPTDSLSLRHSSFGEDSTYLSEVRGGWQQGLVRTLESLPQLDWLAAPSPTPLGPGTPVQ